MSCKIMSIDVGIKNLAYCIFVIESKEMSEGAPNVSILDWAVVNLLNKEPAPHVSCTIPQKNGKICGKKAKYEKLGNCYCEVHAKTTDYLMPTKSNYPTYLKKQKIGELYQIALNYQIPVALNLTRRDVTEKILNFFEERCLKLIQPPSSNNANKESLINIARSIRDKFNEINSIQGVTDILIENQISPIASRMTSIQGLLTQYFVMTHERVFEGQCPEVSTSLNIEFISSRNKLKLFTKETTITEEDVPSTNSQKYQKHKQDSIVYTKQLMEKYPAFKEWEHVLNTPKKDDLADCFLQGMWYIQTKEMT